MRSLLLVFLVVTVGCTREDRAEKSAVQVVEKAEETPAPAVALTSSHTSNMCGMGETAHQCNGNCGNGCGAAGGEMPTWSTPANARWTELSVSGMHCGGCARRIERALAKVDGVLGVRVDLATGSVKVATSLGSDGRALAKPAIDALGYKVQ